MIFLTHEMGKPLPMGLAVRVMTETVRTPKLKVFVFWTFGAPLSEPCP